MIYPKSAANKATRRVNDSVDRNLSVRQVKIQISKFMLETCTRRVLVQRRCSISRSIIPQVTMKINKNDVLFCYWLANRGKPTRKLLLLHRHGTESTMRRSTRLVLASHVVLIMASFLVVQLLRRHHGKPVFSFFAFALSSTTSTPSTSKLNLCRPIRRVAIVGSGIAGLSVAHALTNSPNLHQSAQDAIASATAAATSEGKSSSSSTTPSTSWQQQQPLPEFEVSLFDSRSSFGGTQAGGAGVQLNGGLAVLNKINPLVSRSLGIVELAWVGDFVFE